MAIGGEDAGNGFEGERHARGRVIGVDALLAILTGGEEKEERRQRGRQIMKRWSVKDMMEASMKEAWRRTTRWEGERKEERSGGEQKRQ